MNQNPPHKQSPSRLLRLLASPRAWFAVALTIRFLYMLDQAGTSPLFYVPLLDEKEAIDSARALLNGTVSHEPYFKAPGYSWIVAAVIAISGDAWPWILRIIQHLAGAGLVFLAAKLAARIPPAGNRRTLATAAAGLFAATYAPLIRLEENVSLDFWVVFFQSAMLYYLAKLPAAIYRPRITWKPILTAGIFAAIAWIIRPTITAILPFVALWIFAAVHRISSVRQPNQRHKSSRHSLTRALRYAVLFLLPVLITAAGVTIRNQVVSSQPLVLPWQGGFNFYHANRPGVSGRYFIQQGFAKTTEANPTYHLMIDGYRESLSPAARTRFDATPDYAAINSYWMDLSLDAIKEVPADWLSLMTRKLVYLVSDKEIYNYEDFDLQRSRSALLQAMLTTFGIVFAAALASLTYITILPPHRRDIVILLWLYTITLGGAIALYYVSGRMRMPIAFPMIVLGGHLIGMLLTQGNIRRATAAALVGIGLIISYGDWWGVRSESMAHADLARMSNDAWHRGRYEQALDLAREAERLAPDNPTIPRLKGQALYYLGQLPQARHEFEKSVRLLGDPTSQKNIEVIDAELKKETGKTVLPP